MIVLKRMIPPPPSARLRARGSTISRASSSRWTCRLIRPRARRNVQRTYTISSSPSRPLSISITVKAQSTWSARAGCWDHLKPGMGSRPLVQVGIFSFHRGLRRNTCSSRPVRASPTMSMTTWAWDLGEMPDIVFVHAAKRPSEIIFRERLEQFANRVPGLQLRFTVEELIRSALRVCYKGRLFQIMLGLDGARLSGTRGVRPGPWNPFMQAARYADLDRPTWDHYHQEKAEAEVRC